MFGCFVKLGYASNRQRCINGGMHFGRDKYWEKNIGPRIQHKLPMDTSLSCTNILIYLKS